MIYVFSHRCHNATRDKSDRFSPQEQKYLSVMYKIKYALNFSQWPKNMHKTVQRVLGATRFVTSHHKCVCELAVIDYISIVMTITIDTFLGVYWGTLDRKPSSFIITWNCNLQSEIGNTRWEFTMVHIWIHNTIISIAS